MMMVFFKDIFHSFQGMAIIQGCFSGHIFFLKDILRDLELFLEYF